MEMEMELDFDFGFIGPPSNSIFVSETKMELELDFQWTGGRSSISIGAGNKWRLISNGCTKLELGIA